MGEHLPYKQRVIGSSPIVSMNGPVVQLVRTLACHARGHEFESRPGRFCMSIIRNASVAQLVEQGIENSRVVGSIPTGGISYADLAHLVERNLAKVEVAGPSPVIRLKTAAENAPSFCFLCVPSSANRAADSFPSDDRRHTRLTGGYLKKTNPRETRFS